MKELLNIAIKAAIEASKEVLKIYNDQSFSVSLKEDESPVTTGDLKANEIINSFLKSTEIPILSEESVKEDESIISKWKQYWCIDPIDGTKEYVNQTGEYCVSIGILTPETSLLGVLAAPSLGLFYFAAEGIGCYKWNADYSDLFKLYGKSNLLDEILKNSIKLPLKVNSENYIFLTSRSHFSKTDELYYEELKKQHSNIRMIPMGSAIKVALVAEGKANEYARLSSVNFWDLAGGHAIAKYAGLEIREYKTQNIIQYKNISTLKIPGYIVKNI